MGGRQHPHSPSPPLSRWSAFAPCSRWRRPTPQAGSPAPRRGPARLPRTRPSRARPATLPRPALSSRRSGWGRATGHGDPCGAIQLTPTSPELVWASSEVSELAQLLGSHPVRELDLSGSVLGDANAALLAEGLAAALAKGCRRVRLDRAHLGNDGLSALSRAATRALSASEPHFSSGDSGGSVHGAELSLADNKINDMGGGYLSSLLLRHLARLDLSGNALTDRMARLLLGHIRTSPLRELDLSRNEITPGFVEKLRSVRNRSGQRVHVKAAGQRAPGSEPPAHHRKETPPPPPAGGTNYDSGRWHAGMLPWKAAKESIAALQSD
eukprot:COSAG04_NODE_306_length_17292_cov_58.911766_1_plen_325_part_10